MRVGCFSLSFRRDLLKTIRFHIISFSTDQIHVSEDVCFMSHSFFLLQNFILQTNASVLCSIMCSFSPSVSFPHSLLSSRLKNDVLFFYSPLTIVLESINQTTFCSHSLLKSTYCFLSFDCISERKKEKKERILLNVY